jgi:hypothetical protein
MSTRGRICDPVDSRTGRKPVKAIYRREEIFKGKHLDTAPDILMEPAETYSLTHAKSALELFGRLCAITGSAAEAEEVMQDAFLALWERWDRVGTLDSSPPGR